ncbi:uncharacterized protein LOC135127533 [Zophobas morio]|uniref:uncharacterized protein LOC135127533 n=1 Tax=Zophobas morio TaxID=2755281 RepID=UPI0030833539
MAYCSKGRVCITLKKPSQLKTEVDVAAKENFDFAEALESVYPLLEIVFSYLDYNDLQTAALVKKSWQVTASRILEKRNDVSWITVFRKKRQSYVHYSKNYLYNNISLGIILFNYRAVSLSDCFCCHEDVSSRKIKFSDFLADQVVPSGTEYCVIGCPGVASMFSKQVINKSSVPLFDGCFIPPIPNVRVSMFYCNPIHMRDDHIKPNERLKCLLLFCKIDLEESVYDIFEHLLPERDFRSVAVGGGIIRRTVLFPHPPDCLKIRKCGTLCITFAEDMYCESAFDTSSVVINGNNLSSEDFEDELLKFKNKIVIRSNSMAFRICCSAKMRKNHESRIFNKVFPLTPLLGLEAEGEIGWNCFNLPDSGDEFEGHKPKRAREGYPTVQHQWSTVIVFVTWGHLLQNRV